MPPRRWLEYHTPPGPPIRAGHSFYGIAAAIVATIAIADVVAVEHHLLPLSLLPLAIPAGAFACFGSIVALRRGISGSDQQAHLHLARRRHDRRHPAGGVAGERADGAVHQVVDRGVTGGETRPAAQGR